MPSEDLEFLALLNRIRKVRGLDCGQYKDKCIKRRVAVRMRANKVATYRDYLLVLKKNPSEYDQLLDALTINVSSFFRDSGTFAVIEDAVLPQLISFKQKHNSKIIRLWSAGCASGEEPYSLAICLSDLLADRGEEFNYTIYATDIDEGSLAKARLAEYDGEFVGGVDEKRLKRYFSSCNGKYTVNKEVKARVRFKRHDLIADRPLTHLDLILCRNVVIYFSRDLQEKLFQAFYDGLNPGGYLVMGKTETLTSHAGKMFRPVDAKERVYQKL